MRRRWLGLILGLVVLATAPGCKVLATVGVVATEVAVQGAVDHYAEVPPHDRPCEEPTDEWEIAIFGEE